MTAVSTIQIPLHRSPLRNMTMTHFRRAVSVFIHLTHTTTKLFFFFLFGLFDIPYYSVDCVRYRICSNVGAVVWTPRTWSGDNLINCLEFVQFLGWRNLSITMVKAICFRLICRRWRMRYCLNTICYHYGSFVRRGWKRHHCFIHPFDRLWRDPSSIVRYQFPCVTIISKEGMSALFLYCPTRIPVFYWHAACGYGTQCLSSIWPRFLSDLLFLVAQLFLDVTTIIFLPSLFNIMRRCGERPWIHSQHIIS